MKLFLNCAPKLWPWLTVIAICISLEGGALYFQEIIGLFPCELCIYTRVWLTAIVLVCIVGIFIRFWQWPRRIALFLLIALSVGLSYTTWQLMGLEYGWNTDGACSLVANFPSWAPLDAWFPMLFRVQDACSATPTVIFGLSMAEGLTGVCLGYLSAFGIALYGDFTKQA